MPSFAGALVLLLLTAAVASGQEFSRHPTQPDGAKAAMVALVEDCVDRAGRLAFDRAYTQEIRVQVQNLLQIYQTSDAAGLANRQARSLIFAICDTLEDVVPEVEAKRWWDFLKD
jgi:hypothetical protein